MAVRSIVTHPDPCLKTRAAEVETFDAELATLAGDLLDTMRAAPGVGITGPHIGVMRRVVVLELSAEDGVRVYVNPRVIEASGDTNRHVEGSVSMPGIVEEVERSARMRIAFQDLAGVRHEEEADGFLAVCLQHEIDQLDGIFWLDRLSQLKRDRANKRWDKARRQAGRGS
ncbi:peptide deformylase [Pinisolibacter sp.]|uniref:peptide deformylase n=1 Tax=Pinisolibacter sp. TaxID=2172024 RepID=UPI002FDDDD33